MRILPPAPNSLLKNHRTLTKFKPQKLILINTAMRKITTIILSHQQNNQAEKRLNFRIATIILMTAIAK
jgi:hypothetical protein